MVVELWCDSLFFQTLVLVTWKSVHWSPDIWVSKDVDVKTAQTEGHAANQPQVTVQPQAGHLGLVDTVLDVTILVVVEGESQSFSKNVLSIAAVEFQLVLSSDRRSKSSRSGRSEHFRLFSKNQHESLKEFFSQFLVVFLLFFYKIYRFFSFFMKIVISYGKNLESTKIKG